VRLRPRPLLGLSVIVTSEEADAVVDGVTDFDVVSVVLIVILNVNVAFAETVRDASLDHVEVSEVELVNKAVLDTERVLVPEALRLTDPLNMLDNVIVADELTVKLCDVVRVSVGEREALDSLDGVTVLVGAIDCDDDRVSLGLRLAV